MSKTALIIGGERDVHISCTTMLNGDDCVYLYRDYDMIAIVPKTYIVILTDDESTT